MDTPANGGAGAQPVVGRSHIYALALALMIVLAVTAVVCLTIDF
jgi:hypothetical protein